MRPSLLHPRSERRRQHGSGRAARSQSPAHQPPARETQARQPQARETRAPEADPAVRRVREAGGPVDRASYVCECGYLFDAAVSTTVTCPHCGAGQAW